MHEFMNVCRHLHPAEHYTYTNANTTTTGIIIAVVIM
jgi:hypothetical protein